MVRLSKKMTDLIRDDIVSLLYNSHEAMFATEISFEIRRDKEFVKKLLLNLKKLGLVEEIKKNRRGIDYKERRRWQLKAHVISAYEA